jgi:hypothetical protein
MRGGKMKEKENGHNCAIWVQKNAILCGYPIIFHTAPASFLCGTRFIVCDKLSEFDL